ncbi:MAG: hypothetical protein ABL967_00535 [Bryobacteraceae bacterium]
MGGNSSPHGYRYLHHLPRAWAATVTGLASALALFASLALFAAPCRAALTVERIAVHQFEDGPILPQSHVFLPGERVYLSCRFAGYAIAGTADEQKSVKLSWQVEAADGSGVPLAPRAAGRLEQQIFTQDKDWRPKFVWEFVIPPFAPGGTYTVTVHAKDEVGGTELTSRLDIGVRGRDVEPGKELVARNLRLLPTDQDGTGLNPAVYHPGQVLWARFEITGFQYAAKNHYSVEYGLAIEKEDGQQVFAQPTAAEDSSESFYPQRYVPGAVSLNLDPNVPLGTYTLVILMNDKTAAKTAEARAKFRIEP